MPTQLTWANYGVSGSTGVPWDQPHSKAEGRKAMGMGGASYILWRRGFCGGVTRVSAKCQGMLTI